MFPCFVPPLTLTGEENSLETDSALRLKWNFTHAHRRTGRGLSVDLQRKYAKTTRARTRTFSLSNGLPPFGKGRAGSARGRCVWSLRSLFEPLAPVDSSTLIEWSRLWGGCWSALSASIIIRDILEWLRAFQGLTYSTLWGRLAWKKSIENVGGSIRPWNAEEALTHSRGSPTPPCGAALIGKNYKKTKVA